MGTRRGLLSADRVVEVAIRVADAEGIDAVTMRRLAEALDVHPTSIYSHLASKEAILAAMADELFGLMSLPAHVDDWRQWIRSFAQEMRRLARTHPGAFMVFTRVPVSGPAARQHATVAFRAFRSAGFPSVAALHALGAVSLAVLGVALNECPPTDGWTEPDLDTLLQDRPEIASAIREAGDSTDGVWEMLVEALIGGLSQRLPARSRLSRRAALSGR